MQLEIERRRLAGWWNNQLSQRRFDLYVLRTDSLGQSIIGRSLSSPIVSPLESTSNWCRLVGNFKEDTDWGYLWYFVSDLSHAEYTTRCRSVVITSQKWSVERTIRENWFLFLAVDKQGNFGTLSTPIW